MDKILFPFRNYNISLDHSASQECQVITSLHECLKSPGQSVISKLTWFCHLQLWWKAHCWIWLSGASRRCSPSLTSPLMLPTSPRVSYIYALPENVFQFFSPQPLDMFKPTRSPLLTLSSLDFSTERKRQTLQLTPTCQSCHRPHHPCIHFQITEVGVSFKYLPVGKTVAMRFHSWSRLAWYQRHPHGWPPWWMTSFSKSESFPSGRAVGAPSRRQESSGSWDILSLLLMLVLPLLGKHLV